MVPLVLFVLTPTPTSPPTLSSEAHFMGRKCRGGDFFNQGVCLVHTRETKRRKLPSYANLQGFRKSQQKANSCTKSYENSLHRYKLMMLFYWNHSPRVNNIIASLSLTNCSEGSNWIVQHQNLSSSRFPGASTWWATGETDFVAKRSTRERRVVARATGRQENDVVGRQETFCLKTSFPTLISKKWKSQIFLGHPLIFYLTSQGGLSFETSCTGSIITLVILLAYRWASYFQKLSY